MGLEGRSARPVDAGVGGPGQRAGHVRQAGQCLGHPGRRVLIAVVYGEGGGNGFTHGGTGERGRADRRSDFLLRRIRSSPLPVSPCEPVLSAISRATALPSPLKYHKPMPSVETFRPEKGRVIPRGDVPSRYKWDLTAICRSADEWQADHAQLDAAIEAFKQFQGTIAAGSGAAARRLPRHGRHGRAELSRLVLRVAAVRRGSAEQRAQRAPAAGADPVRAPAAGELLVQSRAARRFRSRRSGSGWTGTPTSRSIGSRSRACSTSRSTCSTKTASGCCPTPAASTASRTTATRR